MTRTSDSPNKNKTWTSWDLDCKKFVRWTPKFRKRMRRYIKRSSKQSDRIQEIQLSETEND